MTILLGSGYWIVKMYLPLLLARLGLAFAIEYLPDYYISTLRQLSGDPAFLIKGMMVSVAYIVITSIIGCIVFKQADIK